MKKNSNGKLRNTILALGVAALLSLNGCSQAEATDQTGTRLAALESQVETLEKRMEALSEEKVSSQTFEAKLAELQKQTAKLSQINDELTGQKLAFRRDAKRAVAQEEEQKNSSGLLPVAFEDIEGKYGEEEITMLAGLGIFDGNEGSFHPNGSITRAEFVRWLVRTNNRYAGLKLGEREPIRLAEHQTASFTDVPPGHPDFRYIQGMVDAGFVIGYDQTTFAPDRPLSREELVAIKSAVDYNGQKNSDTLQSAQTSWTDADKISKKYYGAFYMDRYLSSPNIPRTFGSIRAFRPQQDSTRAEAAKCLSAITNHGNTISGPKHVTAEDAVKALNTEEPFRAS